MSEVVNILKAVLARGPGYTKTAKDFAHYPKHMGLVAEIKMAVPGVVVDYLLPTNDTGPSFLDIKAPDGHWLVIEHRPGRSIDACVIPPGDGRDGCFADPPDVTFADAAEAVAYASHWWGQHAEATA